MLNIKKPTLVLNESTCKKNIHAMASGAREQNVLFRPHFKTHQSALIGEWFREAGVNAITVSSVSMAQYFALHGWEDITLAFPVNLHEIEEINQLASGIKLNLLLESVETVLFLKERLTADCGFFIKIDTGYHRAGIEASNIVLIEKIINISKLSKLHFKGFLTHSGQSYHAKSKEELYQIQQHASENLTRLKKQYQQQFPDVIVSVGDTPACCQLPVAAGTDEIRPGNFVFFDVMQFALGSCKPEEIAIAVICPVVAVHPNRKEAVIYGGAINLSKDQTLLPPDPEPLFGLAMGWDGQNWETEPLLGKVRSLSQEHGILSLTLAGCNLKPGDLVAVLPVHSCLTANLMRKYYTLDGKLIETMNS